MGALMLLFALTVAGESGTMAVRFDTMTQCEAARAEAFTMLNSSLGPGGAPVAYTAVICVTPIKTSTI